MPIQFYCPDCGQLISIGTRMAGRTVDCPACHAVIVVPAESQTAPAQEPAASKRTEVSTSQSSEIAFIPEAEEAPGFQLQRLQLPLGEMDLTPMVDVTFLLLIFFIFTASMSLQKAIEFPKPDPEQRGATQAPISLEELEVDSIIVEIDAKNTIFIDDEELEQRNQLAEKLRETMQTSSRREIVITADSRAFHEMVVAVFDAANEVGMQKIRLATRVTATED